MLRNGSGGRTDARRGRDGNGNPDSPCPQEPALPPARRTGFLNLLRTSAHLYRLRVRDQPLQELLALLGIAAGVALLFAVQVASTSVTASLRQLAHGVTGRATLEIAARGPYGMDQSIVARAGRAEGVRSAAPVVQQRIVVVGPSGRAPLTLIGVDDRLKAVGGPLIRRFLARNDNLDALGFYLTTPTAKQLGLRKGETLTVESGERRLRMVLAGTLGGHEIGDLEKTPVALAPLGLAQRVVQMQGRISRVLVEPAPGKTATTKASLNALVDRRADVRASDAEAGLLAEAMKPDEKSAAVFSVVAVLIGLLFAYNAMLLVMAQRRRQVAYLRLIGADRKTILATLAFAAAVLGTAASVVGLALGDLLSRVAFSTVPEYLASGFMIGEQRVVGLRSILLSLAGGMIAAVLASAKPARDVMSVEPATATRSQDSTTTHTAHSLGWRQLWIGVAICAISSPLVWLNPGLTPASIVGVIAAMALTLGPYAGGVLSGLGRVTGKRGGIGLSLAVTELRAVPIRAAALALIAAGAVMATTSIGGAKQDLERSVHVLVSDYFHGGDLWISPVDSTNVYATRPFDPRGIIKQTTRLEGVRSVTAAGWSFVDIGNRRVLTVAPPSGFTTPVVPSQVLTGDPALASARIRAGGWVTLSDAVAKDLHTGIGRAVVLPTPSGDHRYRVAAITANHGWPSGCIIMNRGDYGRAWQSDYATALSIDLVPGADSGEVKRAVADVLGPNSPLTVNTPGEMVAQRAGSFAQGLARLQQISTLVLGASILAIVAAMSAAVWQRRTRLASLRAIGMNRRQVYRSLLSESTVVVALGGISGLLFGLYGQFFASHWLVTITGFQTQYVPALGLGAVTILKAVALAAVATMVPAVVAARISPSAGEAG